MQVVGNSVYTSGYAPSNQQAIADARADRRNEELQQRSAENDEQKRKQLQATGDVVSGTSRDADLGYRRVSASNGTNKQYAVYSEEDRRLPKSQQKALQAYTENQNISRVDANIDYLGSVDIFV